MTYTYKRYMRDGSVAVLTGTRHPKQVRTGKTKRERGRRKADG